MSGRTSLTSVMFKIKHERTANCVVAGYWVHKSGEDAIGSLPLGLYKDDGTLASVGVIGAFPMAERRRLFVEPQPLVTTFDEYPWNWAAHVAGDRTRAGVRRRTRPEASTASRQRGPDTRRA
jgi:ATP-dependent DNA ligase